MGASDQNSDCIHAAEPAESGLGVCKEDSGGPDADRTICRYGAGVSPTGL